MALNFVYLLNGISFAAVFFIFIYIAYRHLKEKNIKGISKALLTFSFPYGIMATLFIIWSLNDIQPNIKDFLIIRFSVLFLETILFFIISYYLKNNSAVFILLAMYIFPFFFINKGAEFVFNYSFAIVTILLLMQSIYFIFLKGFNMKKTGLISTVYALSNMVILLLVMKNYNPADMLWVIPNIFLIITMYSIYIDIGSYHQVYKKNIFNKISLFLSKFNYATSIVFVVSISLFLLLSIVGIHEVGHALAAKYYKCEVGKAIIFDISGSPRLEANCNYPFNELIITLSGLFSSLIFSLIFLISGGPFFKRIAALMLGYSLLISYGDLKDLGISDNLLLAFSLLSLPIIIISIISITLMHINVKKDQSERIFNRQIDSSNYFWTEEGYIKNLYELTCYLDKMGDIKFRGYVNNEKNDFYNWIENVIGDKILALQIKGVMDRKKMQLLILKKLFNDVKEKLEFN